MTGNDSGTNTAIGFFNAFNLAAPFWLVPLFEMKTRISLAGASTWLQTFPAIFSAVFFAVPGRALGSREAGGARAREAERAARLAVTDLRGARRGARARSDRARAARRPRRWSATSCRLGGDVAAEPDDEGASATCSRASSARWRR